MATIDFNMVITDEAVQKARNAKVNPGWYLKPKCWRISSTSGKLATTRKTSEVFVHWIESPFSGINSSGEYTLLHHIVIPPNAYSTEMNIGEIYFIYEDYYGNEFLYAIAQPTSSLYWTPGVSQSYYFAFTLNNTKVADTILIEYTYPQDIEDHNLSLDSHEFLLAKDGTRKATGILAYNLKLDFTDNRQIVDKEYVDTNINTVNSTIINKINTTYCPPGTMMMWPKTTPPAGWLVRDGKYLSIIDYTALYNVIGTTFGTTDNTKNFRLPDDRGLFERGWGGYKESTSDSSQYDSTRIFGSIQQDGAPNIKGQFNSTDRGTISGAFYTSSNLFRTDTYKQTVLHVNVQLDASRSSSVYKDSWTEITVKNRAYLPIIKY